MELFLKTFFSSVIFEEPNRNPCVPSPCGPYSICRIQNDRPVCSCSAGYIGVPPNCKPECIVNSECPLDKACQNQKCIDPCIGTCGINALCKVVIHSPICSCPPDLVGDPFSRCIPQESKHISRKGTIDNIAFSIFRESRTNYTREPLCTHTLRPFFRM